MIKNKKRNGKGGFFAKRGQTSSGNKTATTYTLELLESRVLLSGDLGGAVQAIPVNSMAIPQQAVVLNVQAVPPGGQQTLSVSEMLAKQASSFSLSSNAASEATTQSTEQIKTVSEILAQSAEIHTQMSNQQSDAGSQSQQTPLIAAPVMNALQNEVALPPAVQQQPINQFSIQQSVVSPEVALPSGSIEETLTSSSIQTPVVAETLAQLASATNQFSQDQTQSVSQILVQAPLTQTTPTSTTTNSIATTNGASNPELPQLSVDTSMPSTAVTVRVGPHGDYTDLQTALNNVSLGTTILLDPGVSYTSPNDLGFILPNKTTGTGWIVIRPDVADSALPAPGTRMTPADSAMMPKIVRGNVNLYAMSAAPGAHNYRIIGVEFMNQMNLDTPYNGAFVNLDGRESNVSAQSNHIILDRAYIHGPSAPGSVGVKFGVLLGGQYQAVIDSTIEGLHSNDGEAKAIAGWDGAGLWLIRNNFLSASGENIMIGGATPIISGLTPSDIEITHNHFYKPLGWRDDQAYASGLNRVVTKNLLELKNAQRVLIDANLFENVWPDGQSGHAIVLTPRGGGSTGSDPWTTVSDITISNNKFLNVANGFGISGGGPTISLNQGGPTQRGGRILIENNLLVGLGGDYASNYTSGNFATIGMGPSDLQIKHNTVASYAGTAMRGTTLIFSYGIPDEGALFPLNHFVMQDNIFAARAYPMMLSAAGNLSTLMPGYLWTNNVFAGPWPTSGGWTQTMMPQGNGNAYPAGENNVGYVNLSGGDYRLSTTSPYKGAASDGKDIGVDWNQFNAANS